MELFETITSHHKFELGIPSKLADIAIVSIDHLGTPGRLNRLVLKEYGYSLKDLPNQERLVHGFSSILDEKKKPILFVVTVGVGSTEENLAKNLYNTLNEYRGWFRNKNLWLPLMGTGDGGLSLEQSYSITVKTINEFQSSNPTETNILLSIPDSQEGRELIAKYRRLNSLENTVSEVENFVKSFTGKFYLVGSIWGKVDQQPRFFNEGIWEKGHDDDSYSFLISQAQINDIVIIKSTFAGNGISYLRIKALGIVTGILEEGATLSVDWKIKGLSIDVENLGFYRNTIHEVTPSDAQNILLSLDKGRWRELVPSTLPTPSRKVTIPGLVSDSDHGLDYLNIAKDVNAFARVIAAKSFEPPLAIALFGKWGSGKSFFMRKLKEQITKLSSSKTDGIYCEGVAHIHFNAWSYMDANLWASIVTKIFEDLNDYITNNRKANIEKKEIEKLLTDKLSITIEKIGVLESKKVEIVNQISELEGKRDRINKDLKGKIEAVKTKSVWQILKTADEQFDAKKKILAALKENDSYLKTEEELKKIIPEKYWNDPEKTYLLAKSRYTFIIEFFRKDQIQRNVLCLLLIIAIIALSPLIVDLLQLEIGKMNFIIPQAVLSMLITGLAVWNRAETVYNQLQPVIASFWKVKQSYENKMKEVVAEFEQTEKVLKLEIEERKSEVVLIEDQIQRAETIKIDLEFRIENAFATEALYSFIDKRSKSDDYKKHLGLISIIRRDFEILNDLFVGHNLEAEKEENAKQFKEKFERPLERIILYIDDLDRCPEENVVQVLEAVNLLMAFPLFVVVVGVDSRWVKNALLKKHALQFTGHLKGNESLNVGLEMIEPSNYLEKIFQVPFHLKDAEDTSVKDMIKKLAQSKAKVSGYVEEGYFEEGSNVQGEDSTEQSTEDSNSKITPAPGILTDQKHKDRTEALILTDDEIALMQDMSEVIGNSPRAIKRYVNIFRIIKAHDEYYYQADSTNQELIAILFLLALPLGDFRKLLPSFEEYIQNEANSLNQFTLFLQPIYQVNDLDLTKHQLNVVLSDKTCFKVLQATPVGILNKHNSFIRRFSFKQL